jgi:hypothetical protein
MKGEKFFRAVAFPLETCIEPPLDFGLPGRIVPSGCLAEILSQFHTLFHGQSINRPLEFRHAHVLIMRAFQMISRRKLGPALIVLLTFLNLSSPAQVLRLPPRAGDAPGGQAFVKLITPLAAPSREDMIYNQIAAGNVPNWMRQLVLITTNAAINGTNHTVKYYVTPDYLCVGANTDYFLTPMTPTLAQRLANLLGCALPTRQMVKTIWAQAQVKLAPAPIPPGPAMITVPVFNQYNSNVWAQRRAFLDTHPLGSLVAGHKKDVVISALLLTNFHKSLTPVVIYGWQKTNGTPIQPIYNGHAQTWADYSHGIRLVQQAMTVDGAPTTVSAVLTNPALAALLSDETNFPGNTIPRPYYIVAPAK